MLQYALSQVVPATGDPGLADNDEELFDIVDNSNAVIGKERRSLVHARGLMHRAVYSLVFNAEGALLLQQRSPKCARSGFCSDNHAWSCHALPTSHRALMHVTP